MVVTLNSTATVAEVTALVKALTYSNTNFTDPSTLTRTVRITVNDGDGGTSMNADVSVSVVDVNDAPTLSMTSFDSGFYEGSSAASFFSSASVSTVEAGQTLTELEIAVYNVTDDTSEILGADGTSIALTNGNGGTTVTNSMDYSVAVSGSTATVTLSKAAGISAAAMQSLINGLTYINTSEAPTQGGRDIALQKIKDSGGTANSGVDSATFTNYAIVHVVAVNDAPTLSSGVGTPAYTENAAGSVIDSGITVSDPDNNTFASAIVSITAGFQTSKDVLSFINDNAATFGNVSVDSYNAATGVLTLTSSGASATKGQWGAALGAVKFSSSSDAPGTTRTVSFKINDGAAESAAVTKDISVTPVNDAPTDITLSVSSILAINTGVNITVGALSTTDTDDTVGFTYSLVAGTGGTDNASFDISGTDIVTKGTLTTGAYHIRVQTKDSGLATYVKELTVLVTDKTAVSLTSDGSSNDVDNDIEITFASDHTFATKITSVTFDENALTTNQYTVSDDRVTLHPSCPDNDYLHSPKIGAVKILATGYEDSSVAQTITSGAVDTLEVTTQPVPGAETGDLFASQPVIKLKDKYGNVCADGPSASANVTASATAGTGSWTLGGTPVIAASSGVATFSGLTCNQNTSGNGKMTFTCGGKPVSSSTFIIPERNSSISPATAAFDKYASATGYKDISVILTLNKNTLSGIKNGAYTLVEGAGKDYTVSGDICTIKKEYLKTLSAGTANLSFDFSMGVDPVLSVAVSDTTPASSGPSTTTSTAIEVNGQAQDAGTSQTTTTGGQTTTTISVDAAKMDNILQSSGAAPIVALKGGTGSNAVVGELSGQTIRNMENREAVLQIRTDSVTYTLPASQINIDDVSSQFGSQVALSDIRVSVSIAEPSADTVRIVQDTANRNSYQLVVKPVEFEITCTSGGRTVDLSHFNGYVERTVAIPAGVDPSKITTGIVLNSDGTFSHVPTSIISVGGKYFARISSLTNSTYSVIYNPVTFTDIANHWAKAAINDMGSRMIVTGVGSSTYEPDRSITRAEFATVVVRALGLQKGSTESAFGDVALTDWFNGYVGTAMAYSLITGYDGTSYGPNDTITREQAMAVVARAMKLTGLNVSLTDSEVNALLANYTDGASVSNYAKASMAQCIKAGVVSGSSATTLSPKAYVTRAEVAVMIQRLLQKSGLI